MANPPRGGGAKPRSSVGSQPGYRRRRRRGSPHRKGGPMVRLLCLAAVAAALATFALGAVRPASAAVGSAAAADAALSASTLAAINDLRAQHGLVALKLSPALGAAAAQHAREMATDGYFGHPSADGSAFWKRIQGFYGSNGFGLWSVGENLLWSA